MAVRLYNTLTRSKDEFLPLDPAGKLVRFYNCGPTVYGPFHIGNARNFVMMDVVRRWLEYRGYEVRFAQNITDVDDKIIARANKEGVAPEAIAKRYTDLFFEHYAMLGNKPIDETPKATEYLPRMIDAVAALIEKGNAYATADGSAWFSVASFPTYGRLSRKPLDAMLEGERVSAEQQSLKRNPLDFALWKGAKEGEPAWTTPWGNGRPGWHIECTCMSMNALGAETIDIHAGGTDLIFPHHENEIAQSEALTGKPFARYWLHNGFLNIDGEKMSKSLGNVITMDEVFKRIDPLTLRVFLISSHYRMPQDVTDESLHAAKMAARRIVECQREAERSLRQADVAVAADVWHSDDTMIKVHDAFTAAMDDDINTPEALAVLHGLVTQINGIRTIADRVIVTGIGSDSNIVQRLAAYVSLLVEIREVLGVPQSLESQQPELGGDAVTEQLLQLLIDVRAEARKGKQFALSDIIRDRLKGIGIALEDRPGGATVWKKLEG